MIGFTRVNSCLPRLYTINFYILLHALGMTFRTDLIYCQCTQQRAAHCSRWNEYSDSVSFIIIFAVPGFRAPHNLLDHLHPVTQVGMPIGSFCRACTTRTAILERKE